MTVRAIPWARAALGVTGAGLTALLLLRSGGRVVPGWALGTLALATAASFTTGLFVMASGLFGRPIVGADPRRCANRLALTFDDGPHPRHTRAVLDLLERRGHRATFFVIGARGARHPELLEEIVRRGHALGNHSYAHSWTTPALPVRRLVVDLEHAQAVLRATGGEPRWFRPPMGILSPRVAAAARRAGLELVGWTASAKDGVRTDPGRALRRLVRAARRGAILAMHDAAEHDDREPIAVQILPRLLDELDRRGLRSVTLDELLRYRLIS